MAQKGRYVYDWPRPMVTVDAAVFAVTGGSLKILLIQRANDPFEGFWALPGGFIEMDEELTDAAARELAEETGITDIKLEQLRTWGTLGRDPRGRQISIVFTGLVRKDFDKIKHGDDAAKTQWFDVKDLPENLAFDHREIINFAATKISN